MRNLGPVTLQRLAEVGVETEEDLRRLGAAEAWRRLRFAFGKDVTLNALYAMEAALLGCDWRALPEETRRRLRAIAEEYKRQSERPFGS
jgi:DNA transformation protein